MNNVCWAVPGFNSTGRLSPRQQEALHSILGPGHFLYRWNLTIQHSTKFSEADMDEEIEKKNNVLCFSNGLKSIPQNFLKLIYG